MVIEVNLSIKCNLHRMVQTLSISDILSYKLDFSMAAIQVRRHIKLSFFLGEFTPPPSTKPGTRYLGSVKTWLNKRPCKMVKSAKGTLGERAAWAKAWWQNCVFCVLGLRYRWNGHEMCRERITDRGQGGCIQSSTPSYFHLAQLMQYQDLRCCCLISMSLLHLGLGVTVQ